MKQKPTILQALWILLGVQVALLIFFLIAFAWFQPRFSNLANTIQRSDAQIPVIREQISDGQDPGELRRKALILLDSSVKQDEIVQEICREPGKLLEACFVLLLIITIWLGICVYRLQRQNQKNASVPSV